MQDLKALEGKSLAELREIGKALGIPHLMMKKKDLIEKILNSRRTEALRIPKRNKAPPKLPRKPVGRVLPRRNPLSLRRNTGATRRTDHDDTDSRSDKRER